jgi:hypothetical protein
LEAAPRGGWRIRHGVEAGTAIEKNSNELNARNGGLISGCSFTFENTMRARVAERLDSITHGLGFVNLKPKRSCDSKIDESYACLEKRIQGET